MEDPVRRAKEEFVSNLNGTSWVEIDSVLLMQPLCVLILSSLVCFTQQNKVKSRTLIESIVFYLTDFICSVIPLLLLLTVCADFMPAAFQATVVFVVLLLAVVCKNFNSVSLEKLTSTELPHNYISWYRAYVNVLTAICILAVDFRVYPRRLAKTETFGTGLMDIFVGAFIMCNSIVCKEATNLNIDSRKIREKWSGVIRTLQSSLPLTILGVARLVTTKASNYQEHTSEYGVHWNFFLTLALTRVACTVLLCLVRPTLSCVLSVSLAVSYQYLLSNGLQDYILRPGGRVDAGFISANREGIFSTIGYMSLYCAGVAIGQVIFRTRRKLGNKSLLCLLLFILSAVTVLMQVYADSHGYRVSRRLANLPFILWTIHHSVLVLAMMLAVSIIQHVIASYFNVWSLAETNSEIIDAVNYNGLLYFVLANLMTGAVNISTDTLSHSTGQSMVILTLYLLTLNTAVYLLYKAKIRTKFW